MIGRIAGWSLRSRGVVVVLAAVAFLTLPAALAGGVVAVPAGGGVLSLGSVVGLVLVLAVATRNAVLLVSRCQQLARGRDAPTGPGLDMAAERLGRSCYRGGHRPGRGAAGGAGAIPGHEIVQPMALVVLGSLVTTTLLNLSVTSPST